MLQSKNRLLHFQISGGSPHLHEPFQASLALVHVPPDVLAPQAVCIDLHDIDEGQDSCELDDDNLLMGASCPTALTSPGDPKTSSAAAPEHKHSVTAKALLYLYIRGTSPYLHELFQACSGLLHVSADVFALQAVCINLHDIYEGLDACE